MEIKITGEPKEIAALVLAVQERQKESCRVGDAELASKVTLAINAQTQSEGKSPLVV